MGKKYLILIALLLLAAGAAMFYFAHKLGYIGRKDPFSVIPETASFILETSKPVESFQAIFEHPIMKHAGKQAYLAEITRSGNELSKFIAANELIFNQLGKKQTLISVHNVKPDEFDFLFVFNTDMLGDLADFAQNNFTPFFTRFGKSAVKKKKDGTEIFQISGEDNSEILYLTFSENLLLISYSEKLLKMALEQAKKPYFTQSTPFREAKSSTSGSDGRVFLHYKYFDRFAETFLSEPNDIVNHLSKALYFTAAELDLSHEERISLNGYSVFNDSADTYLRALAESGSGTISSPRIIPQQAASIVNFNFDSFDDFYENLEVVFQDKENDYKEYESNLRMLEKLLKVDFRERLTSWIADEMTLIQLKTTKTEELKDNFALAVQAKDITKAKIDLDFIVNQVRKRTPFRFSEQHYRGYSINFLNIKGFFKIFLGKFFEKIEKPYFTIIEDYVIFSNNPETLKMMIDDYEIGLTLAHSEKFNEFFGHFSKTSNIFIWVNTPFALQSAPFMVEPETWQQIIKNQQFITCYEALGIQMKEDGGKRYSTQISMTFRNPQEVAKDFNAFYTLRDEKLKNTESDGTMSKLRELVSDGNNENRFNLTDFLVTDSELFNFEKENKEVTFDREVKKQSGDTTFVYNVRENLKDGLYKEYIEGVLRVKGKYRDDFKEGVWRFYDASGVLEKKEHYHKGEKEFFE